MTTFRREILEGRKLGVFEMSVDPITARSRIENTRTHNESLTIEDSIDTFSVT